MYVIITISVIFSDDNFTTTAESCLILWK